MQTQIINFRAYIVSLGNFDNLNVCNLISQMLSYHTWMWGTESNVQVLFIFIKKKVFISSRNHNVKIWLVTIDKYVFIYHWRRLIFLDNVHNYIKDTKLLHISQNIRFLLLQKFMHLYLDILRLSKVKSKWLSSK